MHIKSANHAGFIYARSGLATKDGLRPANCVGVVDSDYQGEWIIALHNDSDVRREIKVGIALPKRLLRRSPVQILMKLKDSLKKRQEPKAALAQRVSRQRGSPSGRWAGCHLPHKHPQPGRFCVGCPPAAKRGLNPRRDQAIS